MILFEDSALRMCAQSLGSWRKFLWRTYARDSLLTRLIRQKFIPIHGLRAGTSEEWNTFSTSSRNLSDFSKKPQMRGKLLWFMRSEGLDALSEGVLVGSQRRAAE